MKNKGLAMTIIFQAESANYGESLGNISSLKKISKITVTNIHIFLAKQFATT